MLMIYPVALEIGNSSQSIGVMVPDLPSCFSAGKTVEDALRNVTVSISLQLESLISQGKVAPFGSPISRYMDMEDFKGCVWALVNVRPTEYLGANEKINITLPSILIEKIDKYINENPDYSSRSEFLAIGAELLLVTENTVTNLKK